MNKNLRWKILVIVAVTALAVWSFTPPSQKVKLGLDLKGGVHLVLKVKTDDALKVETETAAEQLREALKTAKVATRRPGRPDVVFTVEGVPPANDQQFRVVSDEQLSVNYDRRRTRRRLRIQDEGRRHQSHRADSVTQALQTIERRVNELGVSEPVVAPYGSTGDQIIVQLPGVKDVDEAKKIIGNPARLRSGWSRPGPRAMRRRCCRRPAAGAARPGSDGRVGGDRNNPITGVVPGEVGPGDHRP